MGLRITGLMPHGATYWEDNGVIDPTRDDYIFHIEYNYISKVGEDTFEMYLRYSYMKGL